VIPDVLNRLLTAAGPSGNESAPAAAFREAASAFAEVSHDTLGSTVARVAGTGSGPTLAVVGHIDEIGMIVHHIDDEGFLWFSEVGGWDTAVLIGQRVDIFTRDGLVPGVIGRKATHLLEKDEKDKVPETRQLHIDIGAVDGDDARARVRIGDVAVITGEPMELEGGRVVSRALDNRLGCYVAFEAARLVAEAGGAPGAVCAVAVAQEETTLGGAATTAFSLEPDLAIVVDVSHETGQPGIEERRLGRHRFGSGPILARGTALDPQIFELLHDTAEAEDIPFTVEAIGRRTGTDADAFHIARGGIPSALIGVQIRYMHSPVEMVHLEDVENCSRLIAAFAQRLPEDISFLR
jgi:putative aminopeptidase FrvX